MHDALNDEPSLEDLSYLCKLVLTRMMSVLSVLWFFGVRYCFS